MKPFSRYTFDYAFRWLLILLPFMTVLSVFTKEKLGIPGFSFVKELLLISMLMTLMVYHIMRKMRILWTRYDVAILAYILILVVISSYTTHARGIIYGWRYDFSFLIAFFVIIHGYSFLEKPLSYYLRLFLFSGGIMLFVSMLLKWPFSEDLLLYLGYSGNPSNWQFGSSIPIFHGVDGANVRRFQWLLDGPNTMGAFLLIYAGIFTYYFREKKSWFFVMGWVLLLLSILIFFTYSRSAAIWLFLWVGIIILFLLRYVFTHYKRQFITLTWVFIFIIGGIFIQYADNMKAILERGGSTSGHMERMKVGIERFTTHPLGQWLGSAGPAYRYVQDLTSTDRQKIEEMDRYYIPESWYIQQLIEGGIFWFLAFMSIMIMIGWSLYKVHILLLGTFISICVMNFFLHTFESSVVSLSMFLLFGLILGYSRRVYVYK